MKLKIKKRTSEIGMFKYKDIENNFKNDNNNIIYARLENENIAVIIPKELCKNPEDLCFFEVQTSHNTLSGYDIDLFAENLVSRYNYYIYDAISL